MPATSKVIFVSVLLLLVGGGLIAYQALAPSGCGAVTKSTASTYHSWKLQFGAVTEYCLASPVRSANGVAVGPDGSVWFGEQSLPGIGRLFPNGTVSEFAWPEANGSGGAVGGYKTGIWGIALWEGMVWGTDSVGNSIVGYSPSNGTFRTLTLPIPRSQPYTLTTGPDGALWFTSLSQNATLGRVAPNLKVSMYPVLTNRDELPAGVEFANATTGYYVAFDPYNGGRSGLYSFDPRNVFGGVRPERVGGNYSLIYPLSLWVTPTTVWVEQHLASSIVAYDIAAGNWTDYPTSTLPFTNTALPYFVQAAGGTVWYNEHYSNRMAKLDPVAGTLTEFSEADPPITVKTLIQNDLTLAATPTGAWFTSWTGNYIGYVVGSYMSSYGLRVVGPQNLSFDRGGSLSTRVQVTGTWSRALSVSVSDNENFTSYPSLISIKPADSTLPAGSGPITMDVVLSAKNALLPGKYTVAVTVGDGLVYQTAYIFVDIT